MKTKKETLEQSMINYLREKKINGLTVKGYNRGKKIYAGIRGKEIRIQEYSNDSEVEMLLNDYCVAL